MNAAASSQAWTLIIGSLLWDSDPRRSEWRADRLDESQKVRVRTPIRYGRKSRGGKRKNQYTMTFSRSAPDGRAYALACRHTIDTIEGLIEEAAELSQAEGLCKSANRWERFGAVGILFRDPQGSRSADLREKWMQHFDSRVAYDSDLWREYERLTEPAPINRDGLLTIPWPIDDATGTALPGSILLAAVNVPSPIGNRYALPDEIAHSIVCEAPRKAEYMRNNVANSIRTFQDLEIWQAIEANCRWIGDPEYSTLADDVRRGM